MKAVVELRIETEVNNEMAETKSLIYQILKVIESGKEPKLADLDGVTLEGFHSALEQIMENKLATHISFTQSGKSKGKGKQQVTAHLDSSTLTAQGSNYIHMQESREY